MKSPIFILLAIYVLSFSSCKNKTPIVVVQDNAITGNWKVTKFTYKAKDETSNFSNFKITFSDNGVVFASDSTEKIFGTYSIYHAGSADNKTDPNAFWIRFPSTGSLTKLTRDWGLRLKRDSIIILQNYNSGYLVTDSLIIVKN